MKFLLKILVIVTFFLSLLNGSYKDTKVLAEISTKPLFELDKDTLDSVISHYVEDKDKILSVRVTDLSYNEVYWSYSKNGKSFESNCNNKNILDTLSIEYELKEIGKIDVCYNKTILVSNSVLNEYTIEEKKWLIDNPIIKIAKLLSWTTDRYGNNIHTDYVNLLSQYGQLDISLVGYESWSKAFEDAIKGNNVQGILNLSHSYNREDKKFIYVEPYYYTPLYIITRKDENGINSIDDLKNQYVISKKDSITYDIIKEVDLNIKPIVIENDIDMIKELSKEDSKAKAMLAYVLDESLFEKYGLKIANIFYNRFGEVHIGISKKYPLLASILKKAHNRIPTNELSSIQNKIYEINNNYNVKLTSYERDWIKNKKKITFMGDPKWLPIEGFNEKGEYIGFVSEYLKKFEKTFGIKIEKIETKSWSETLQLANNNEVDLISDDIKNPILYKHYMPIEPYLESPLVIVMDKETTFVENLNSLSKKKIAVIKEYGYVSELYKKFPNINFIEVDNIKDGLTDLASNKYDAMVGTAAAMSYSIKSFGFQNLRIVGSVDIKMNLTLFVKKDEIILFDIISKFIASIDEAERQKIKNKYNDINFEPLIDYKLIQYIVIIFVVFLLIAMYYNRRLQILVDEKTFQLQDLLKNLEKKVNLRTKELKSEKDQVEKLNEELKGARDRAENLAKQKSEFLANMSHEIRTPMNSVIGFTEILDKEITNPIHKEYLDSIKKGGDALLRIINDILDLSKIDAGKMEIKKESINPRNMFFEMESIFHTKIISKNINFLMEIDESLPKLIITDGIRVRQILFNLIGNAIKFTEKGHIKLKAQSLYKDRVKSKVDLVFIVEDTGIGINKKNLKLIFNAFEQQENHNIAKYGGTGLGLSICSKLAKMLNGKIEVESEVGVGSKFIVTLYNLAVSSVNDESSTTKLDIRSIDFSKSTVLVVDDIEENRKLVIAALKNYDIDIIEAKDGREALNRLKNINFDLILMDLRMPVMNGYEAATIIKGDEKLKNIPLIALTASVMGKDFEKVTEYGFDGYLRKPVVLDDLLIELTKYLEYKHVDSTVLDDETNEVYDAEKLKKFIEIVEHDLSDEYNEVKDSGDFTLIEEFSRKISKLAKEYNIQSMKTYSQELLNNIDSFDIEKVDYLMNVYGEYIEKLKGKIGV